jgi:hypothetical protein
VVKLSTSDYHKLCCLPVEIARKMSLLPALEGPKDVTDAYYGKRTLRADLLRGRLRFSGSGGPQHSGWNRRAESEPASPDRLRWTRPRP